MSGTTVTVTAPPPAVTIDATGIHAPLFSDLLAWLQDQYQSIYGSDVYLGNDSQDGQLLGIFALAWSGACAAAVSVYNAFSPATAQGTGLSSAVKINGLARLVPSYGNAVLTIVGQANTVITNGLARDANGNLWVLPVSVTIPSTGTIDVTATAATFGAIAALPGTINQIATPTRGWQTVTNAQAAVPGAPVESDGTLRQRQAISTAQPSQTVIDGLEGAIALLPGIASFKVYENPDSLPDANGLPPHSVSVVAVGGDLTQIASTILTRKTIGAATYGTTTVTVNDAFGIPRVISFYQATEVTISGTISLRALTGYSTPIGQEIVAAVVAWINALPIGQAVLNTRLYVPANLAGPYAAPAQPTDALTFELSSIAAARGGGTPAPSDVPIAFNETAVSSVGAWTVVVG